ncbi:hypothetical protein HYS49_03730 [Candidatus Woesearchaeota archaeon]|nr:hypothetical protein [Candidatus Woesearchaeota archaeon]
MKISKQLARTMCYAGVLGIASTTSYAIHLGMEARDITRSPPYRAALQIEEFGEEIATREEAIDDCLATHPQEPDTCLNTVTDYFEYAEQANAETAQLRESFPGYQEAFEEVNSITKRGLELGVINLPFGLLISIGFIAYRNRKAEEAAQQEKAGGLTVDKQ